ncbi:MAG: hypothetical protein LGB07_04390 [Sulfurovum sp.]|nr:hypothetical protein [Sulfurovum sp.]
MHDRAHAAAAVRGFLENGTVANYVAPDLQQINGAATSVVDILIWNALRKAIVSHSESHTVKTWWVCSEYSPKWWQHYLVVITYMAGAM